MVDFYWDPQPHVRECCLRLEEALQTLKAPSAFVERDDFLPVVQLTVFLKTCNVWFTYPDTVGYDVSRCFKDIRDYFTYMSPKWCIVDTLFCSDKCPPGYRYGVVIAPRT